MGGPSSFFNDPFGTNAKQDQSKISYAQNTIKKRDELISTVSTTQDLTDADRQKFAASLNAMQPGLYNPGRDKITSYNIQQLDDLNSAITAAIEAQRKKREMADKQRALINEAPGTRLTQTVNTQTLGSSPLVTATANPGLV